MKREYYDEEMMVKESITAHKGDKEIGMPDIESELRRVKAMAKRPEPMLSRWRRIAAVWLLVLSVTGLTWAVYHQYRVGMVQDEKTEQNQAPLPQVAEEQTEEHQEATVSEQLTLFYDKASLEQVIVDLTAFYHLDRPEFKDIKSARKCMLHVSFRPESDIHEAVALLNQFGSIHVEVVDNKLVVK